MEISKELFRKVGALIFAIISTVACNTFTTTSIDIQREGSGQVNGIINNQLEINCGANCNHSQLEAFGVVLTAIPLRENNFIEWQGDGNIAGQCGTNPICSFSVPTNEKYNIHAIFTSDESFSHCSSYLVDGVKGFFIDTGNEVYFNAMRSFLCKTDWNLTSNTTMKGELEGAFSAIFGDLGEISLNNKFNTWVDAQCGSDNNIDFSTESTFELKFAADLELLQAYEQCRHDASNPADLSCVINHPEGSDLFTLSIAPRGEGHTITNIVIEEHNATPLTNNLLPEYLTAFDNLHFGSVDVNYQIDDIAAVSLVTVAVSSEAYGSQSCTRQIVPEPTYTLRGTITGLEGEIVIDDGNDNQVTMNGNGVFTFGAEYVFGAPYNISIVNQPLRQNCEVLDGAGIFGNSNVTNVEIGCVTKELKVAFDRLSIALLDGSADGAPPYSYNGWHESYADVNGDGLQDKIWVPKNRDDLYVALSTGTRFDTPTIWLAKDAANGAPPYSFNGWHESYVDVNNDGLQDRVWVPKGRDDLYVALSTGTRFGTPTIWLAKDAANGAPPYSYNGWHESYADVNGDGLQDKIWVPKNRDDLYVALSTGTRFDTPTIWLAKDAANGAPPYSFNGWHESYTDINGDGLQDRVWVPKNRDDLYAALSTGTRFDTPRIWISSQAAGGAPPYSFNGTHESYADVNGDNLPDKIWIPKGREDIFVALSTGTEFTFPIRWLEANSANGAPVYSYNGWHESYADINGDGLQDRVWVPKNRNDLYVALSTGESFKTPLALIQFDADLSGIRPYSFEGRHESYVDINGDGLPERVWVPHSLDTLYEAFFTNAPN